MKAWDWSRFKGSAEALKWNKRDLPNLSRVISQTPQKRVAVQAGGHLGIWPKRLAMSFDNVYTFEPAADLFAHLMVNAPEPNIIKFQAALGFTRTLIGLARVRRDTKGTPPHEGLTHVCGDGPIPTLLIDDLGLKVCDLICLDLEGWELFALRGAVETIQRCRPVLCIEVNKNQRYVGVDPEFLRAFIKERGYRFVEKMHSDEVYVPAEWTQEAVA